MLVIIKKNPRAIWVRKGAGSSRRTPFFSAVTVEGVIVGRAQVLGSIETVGNDLKGLARFVGNIWEVGIQGDLASGGLL